MTRIRPRSLLAPPGWPDFMTRERYIRSGPVVLSGRAWSGRAPVVRVEVSTDGGSTWDVAALASDDHAHPFLVAGLVLRLGGRYGSVRAAHPGDGRGRRPAGRGGVEAAGPGQQPGPARTGHRARLNNGPRPAGGRRRTAP